jgi:uncharacterized protein (DUF2236 family)
VHGSVATFLGGIRALLLQAAHPRALAGIDGHSSFRQDPFGRLQRTGAFIAATTFGSADLAERTVEGITRMHARVRGELPDGRRYAATDPDLLTWVHVALVDSMLEAYLRFPTNGPVDADAYVADMAVVGAAMGVPDPPRCAAELDASLAAFGPELEAAPSSTTSGSSCCTRRWRPPREWATACWRAPPRTRCRAGPTTCSGRRRDRCGSNG